MLLPYRVKNPPLAFPYATIVLMVINVLVYVFTSENLLSIRENVVENWAFSHETFSFVRMVSAIYLHADLFHLIGNMLFLWVFGAAVEGRVGIPLYLGLYHIAGFAGCLLFDQTVGRMTPEGFGLGASGAIMGLMGAYLYLSPFAQVMVAYFFMFGFHVRAWRWEWERALPVGQWERLGRRPGPYRAGYRPVLAQTCREIGADRRLLPRRANLP